MNSQFNNIAPRTREERAAMKDREKIEQRRLKDRVGGFQRYVDSAQIHNPDPISTHFISEAERFDKEFAVADKKVREQTFDKKLTSWGHLRQERFEKEQGRWNNMEHIDKKEVDRLQARVDLYQAGKKNKGGAAYNIMNLQYDSSNEGQKLKRFDDDAKVRALIRSKNLDHKNNCGYNILTGENRQQISIPIHDKYNPMSSAGRMMMSSAGAPKSSQSNMGGILPGMGA